MNLVVISCAKNPRPEQRVRCETSVLTQNLLADHRYLVGDTPQLEKQYHTIHALHPSDIVCIVDGDDWLLTPNALTLVHNAHEAGAWMTWGQYAQFENGKRTMGGCAHDVRDRRTCRKVPWFASHLRTFRAGLFQQIWKEHLQWKDGRWIPYCTDLAIMFPMLEMACERGRFIRQEIYAYDYTDRRARGQDKPGSPMHLEEKTCVRHVRNLPPYPRLEREPW